MVPVEEGLYEATYVPAAEGKCKLDVKYGGDSVPNRYDSVVLFLFVMHCQLLFCSCKQ